MTKVITFDKLVTTNVLKKCIDKGYCKYSEIAMLLDKSESFVKAVFSSNRKKLNLYHLVKLSMELDCEIGEFLPTLNDYRSIYPDVDDAKEGFIMSIKECD